MDSPAGWNVGHELFLVSSFLHTFSNSTNPSVARCPRPTVSRASPPRDVTMSTLASGRVVVVHPRVAAASNRVDRANGKHTQPRRVSRIAGKPRFGDTASHAVSSIAVRPETCDRTRGRSSIKTSASSSGYGNNNFASSYETKPEAQQVPLDIPHWHSRALITNGRVFSETFPVRFDECGPDKRSTMRTVAGMIQECACNHAQGIWGRAQSMPVEMSEADLAWVRVGVRFPKSARRKPLFDYTVCPYSAPTLQTRD